MAVAVVKSRPPPAIAVTVGPFPVLGERWGWRHDKGCVIPVVELSDGLMRFYVMTICIC